MNRKTTSLALTLIIFLVMTATIAPIGATIVWEPEMRLTTDGSWEAFPSIAQTADDRIWFVWQSDKVNNWTFDIYRISWDRWMGKWYGPKRLTTDPSHDVTPSLMVTNNGTMWLFWSSMRTGNYDVFYKKSFDNGYTWTNATQFTTNPERDVAPSAIQDANGTIWVVWQAKNMGVYDVFYKKSFDNGYTWTNATQLTTNVYNDENPSIFQMQDGRIWVVWQYATEANFEIACKIHNGSWSSAALLVENPDFDWDPSIVQSRDGMIWLFWSRELKCGGPVGYQDDLFYKVSVDNGDTWEGENRLTTDEGWNENGQSAVHSIADRKLWLTWHSDKDDNFDVYYMKSNIIINRDVAITDVAPNSTMIYQNRTVSINVTAENQGERRGHDPEIFTVNCYVNTTLIGSELVTLREGISTVITFSWNTSNFAFGPYTISANATAVPDELPINLVDNTYIDGTVLVTVLGDIDGDGDVDRYDYGLFAAAYGTSEGDPDYDPRCDFDDDADVDRYDYGIFAANYGRSI